MVDHVTSMGGVRMDPSDIELLSLGVILPSLGTRSLREWTRALGAGSAPPPTIFTSITEQLTTTSIDDILEKPQRGGAWHLGWGADPLGGGLWSAPIYDPIGCDQ